MGKRSQTTLATVEKPESLEITRSSQNTWVSLSVLPLASLILAGLAWAFQLLILAILAVAILFVFVVNRRNGSKTVLTVTESEVESHGNLGYISQKDIIMEASEVEFLGYSSGGKGRPWGLYAGGRGLFEKTCVMPFITEDEASKIADKIRRKFPIFDAAASNSSADNVVAE